MAVQQATRLRTAALPVARPGIRPPAAGAAAGRSARVRPVGMLLAAILAATVLGLVYLTQTLGSNATSSEIHRLEGQRADLTKELRRQAVQVWARTDSEAIVRKATALGLRDLGDPVVLRAP